MAPVCPARLSGKRSELCVIYSVFLFIIIIVHMYDVSVWAHTAAAHRGGQRSASRSHLAPSISVYVLGILNSGYRLFLARTFAYLLSHLTGPVKSVPKRQDSPYGWYQGANPFLLAWVRLGNSSLLKSIVLVV